MAPTKEDFDRIGNYALMLGKDTNIDRHKCHRVVPLEVLHLAFSRTGTLSMQKALEILGYPNPYHFSSMYGNIKDVDMWMEAFRAKYQNRGTFGRAEFDKLLGHCGAVTDAPCMVFAPELMDAYPDAKVILVERDEDSWHRSWCTLVEGAFNPIGKVFAFFDPWWYGRIQELGMYWMETHIHAKSLQEARDNAPAVYREHYVMMRMITPKERILEYRLGSGWEPLCEFLRKPVPEVPFPHLNESKSITMVFDEMGKKAIRNSLWNLAMVGGTVTAVGVAIWMGRR